VAVLALVVDRRAPLHQRDERIAVERHLGAGALGQEHILGEIDGAASVAVRHGDQRFARVGRQRQLASGMGFCAGKQCLDRRVVETLEGKDARPRQ
jgi:hypothetical protein